MKGSSDFIDQKEDPKYDTFKKYLLNDENSLARFYLNLMKVFNTLEDIKHRDYEFYMFLIRVIQDSKLI